MSVSFSSSCEIDEINLYTNSAHRLCAALKNIGITAEVESLIDLLLDNFSNDCYLYTQALFQPAINWHLVELGPACHREVWQNHDPINQTPSLVEALAFSLEQLDYGHMHPDTVRVSGDQVEFLHNGEMMIRLRPVVYEPVDEVGRQRATTAMKGLQTKGYMATIPQLRKLPGFEALNPPSFARLPDAPSGAPLNIVGTELARRLRASLAELGIIVRQSQALDLTVATFDVPGWHQLVAREKQLTSAVLPPTHVTVFSDAAEPLVKCYRSTADALWAFARLTKDSATGETLEFSTLLSTIFMKLGQPDGKDSANSKDCYTPPVVWPGPRYLAIAERLLADTAGLAAALSVELNLEAPQNEKRVLSQARAGVEVENALHVQDWVLTRRGEALRQLLTIERFDAQCQLLERHVIPVYKAELRKSESGDLELWHDYGRTLTATLNGLTDADVAAVVEFTGIRWGLVAWLQMLTANAAPGTGP